MNVPPAEPAWGPSRQHALRTVARNVSTRYVLVLTDIAIGLSLLPFNLAYLGTAEYGLWVLLGSVSIHLSALEMGNSGALVKFMAQYRAHNNARAINEIASTIFVTFGLVGLAAYGLLAGVAFNLEHLFTISAEQARVGQWVLLMIGLHAALNFPFAVFGSVTSGFQRYDINNVVALVTTVTAAIVNVAVVLAGYGLLHLVAATTLVRMSAYVVYRANAYRVFPELQIRPTLFRRERLKEVLGFSVYMTGIDWANKLNYQLDQVVVGAFLGPAAVAVWAPAERVVTGVQRLTNQVNSVLFPLIVDSDQMNHQRRLQQILLQGTRFSLVMVVPIAATIFVLADPLIRGWLGSGAESVAGAIPVLQVLAVAVAIRVGESTGTTVLKGAGRHRMLAGVHLGTGIVNVALSALLIGPFGLMGVAAGTVIPIAGSTIFILFPAACRRVGLPVGRALRQAVLPAVWPAVVAAACLWWLRPQLPANLLGVGVGSVASGVLYLALFVGVAISRADRAFYWDKALQLLQRGPRPEASPAEA